MKLVSGLSCASGRGNSARCGGLGFCASLGSLLSVFLLPFAFCPLLTSCSPSPVPAPDTLALVNGQPVSEASYRHSWTNQPPAAETPDGRMGLLDQLIERSALAQAARAAGLDRDPLVIESFERLLIARFKETELEPRLRGVRIPEEDLRAHYEAERAAKFTEPERIRVAVLWFDTRGQAPLVARYEPRLKAIRARLLSGQEAPAPAEGFGPLAIRNSEHRSTRYKGGDLGWLEAGGGDPWRNTVMELAAPLERAGQTSEVFAGEAGLFLVRLIERRPARVQPFENVRPAIERRLLAERRRAIEQEFNAAIRQHARVEVFPERLAALADLEPSEAAAPVPSPMQFTAR
ncbi:MAG: peptidyl-prolyl cis-trans isomerase [Verrucomicrobiales bacterium]|nr:peptidyl-prolyl cis-trans isomerase [Verrucomicrobiales bacterium]